MTNNRMKDLYACQKMAIEQNKKLWAITFTDNILDPLFLTNNNYGEVLKAARLYIKQWRINGTIYKCFEVDTQKEYSLQDFESLLW